MGQSTQRGPELPLANLSKLHLLVLPDGARWREPPTVYYFDGVGLTNASHMIVAFFDLADAPLSRPDAQASFTETIHVYGNAERARRGLMPYWKSISLRTPERWGITPEHADCVKMKCFPEEQGNTTCIILLCYEEYLLELITGIPDDLSMPRLEALLVVTDRFMAAHLANSELEIGPRQVPDLSERTLCSANAVIPTSREPAGGRRTLLRSGFAARPCFAYDLPIS